MPIKEFTISQRLQLHSVSLTRFYL